MKKKYRIKFRSIIILVFFVLIIFCCVRFFSKGHIVTYKIGEEKYEVTETYTKNTKNEFDNYYVEVTVNDVVYGFQFYHNFSMKRKILEDVITYQGDYECVLPIVEGKAITDLLCYKDYRYYDYNAIMGKEEELDKFVNQIDITIYDKDDWQDKSTDTEKKEDILLYSHNVIKDHFLLISNLKGVYQINEDVKKIEVFDKDIYQRELSAFVDHYYVTADYGESQQFRTFYFVDMLTGKIETAKAPNYISFDAYLQGVLDGKLYLYDKDNEKQYRISPNDKKIEEIGNSKKKVKIYQDNEWKKITTTKANKEVYFEPVSKDYQFQKYDKIYHVGGEVSGYYYLLEKVENGYRLYRTPSQNKKIILYITTVNDLSDLYFLDDYVYFQEQGKIKYYQSETGIRTLLEYSELEFNKNLIFGVAKK